LNLRAKVASLCDILRLSWEEHEAVRAEDDMLLEEIELENSNLRKLLLIGNPPE
jgi:hypothetical protein